MENPKASDLLNQYLPELEGFEAGLKAWFSDLEHEKTLKINQLFLFNTISAITAFIAYTVGNWNQVWQKLSYPDKNFYASFGNG